MFFDQADVSTTSIIIQPLSVVPPPVPLHAHHYHQLSLPRRRAVNLRVDTTGANRLMFQQQQHLQRVGGAAPFAAQQPRKRQMPPRQQHVVVEAPPADEYGLIDMIPIVGKYWQQRKRAQAAILKQLDDYDDYRPYFTYWATTVQVGAGTLQFMRRSSCASCRCRSTASAPSAGAGASTSAR